MECAMRLSHTLKGVAGVFSAKDLFESASELEMGIRNREHQRIDALMDDFESALMQVLESARLIEQHNSMDTEKAPRKRKSGGSGNIDMDTVSALMSKMADLLSRNNPQAEDFMDQVKNHLNHTKFHEQMENLENSVGRYDFKNAYKALASLAKEMGISLEI